MSGIYIHIPFCKQACYYCDFHFSTNQKPKNELIKAICKEIFLRKDYLPHNTKIQSIYFGGGTPSLLSYEEIELLLTTIYQNFEVSQFPEITFEANPDDIYSDKLKEWKNLGINRLSIGVQTFQPRLLKKLNRVHSSQEAQESLEMVKDNGFDNFNIDLIYALPEMTIYDLQADLDLLLKYQSTHISIYGLTIEEKTVFGNWYKKGKLKLLEEENVIEQFELIMQTLQKNGYEQYEISNFAKHQHYAQHNLSYWQNKTYLGIGPSAHSYNGINRHYNIGNNANYLKSLKKGQTTIEEEVLSQKDRLNEYLMTSLRTQWGCNLSYIKTNFDVDLWNIYEEFLNSYMEKEWIKKNDSIIFLTEKGKLLADEIIKNLFFV